MPLFLIFILVPMIEIYLLIKVGGMIGAFPTILLIFITAVLGTWLLRQQGLSMIGRYQQSVMQGRMPAQELIAGLALLFGGALLLTPGFFTDFIGFLCLIPVTRRSVIRWIMKRVSVATFSANQGNVYDVYKEVDQKQDGRTIEGECSVKKDDQHW